MLVAANLVVSVGSERATAPLADIGAFGPDVDKRCGDTSWVEQKSPALTTGV
jgi:hypothetical protein